MRRADEVLEVRVAHDDPVVAVVVALPLDLRAGGLRDRVHELVDVVEGAAELAGRLRLERDRRRAGRLQPEVDLHRDRRGRQREELILLRLGELLSPEQDVAETHRFYATGRPISRAISASAAIRFSSGG